MDKILLANIATLKLGTVNNTSTSSDVDQTTPGPLKRAEKVASEWSAIVGSPELRNRLSLARLKFATAKALQALNDVAVQAEYDVGADKVVKKSAKAKKSAKVVKKSAKAKADKADKAKADKAKSEAPIV